MQALAQQTKAHIQLETALAAGITGVQAVTVGSDVGGRLAHSGIENSETFRPSSAPRW